MDNVQTMVITRMPATRLDKQAVRNLGACPMRHNGKLPPTKSLELQLQLPAFRDMTCIWTRWQHTAATYHSATCAKTLHELKVFICKQATGTEKPTPGSTSTCMLGWCHIHLLASSVVRCCKYSAPMKSPATGLCCGTACRAHTLLNLRN